MQSKRNEMMGNMEETRQEPKAQKRRVATGNVPERRLSGCLA